MWEDAGVHPRDIRTLDDFRERVPFVDKDAVRRFRDERGDPFGGTLCVPPGRLTGVASTSGTTGDPTLVPELWDAGPSTPSIITRPGWGIRPGDHIALVLFTFAARLRAVPTLTGTTPILFDFDPAEMERFKSCRSSSADGRLQLRSVPINAVKARPPGFDPHDVRVVLGSLRMNAVAVAALPRPIERSSTAP
jgi:phenylacetate-CoA ligase